MWSSTNYQSVLQSKEIVEKCDIAIARSMIDASVPFNAINSAYYQPMIDAIANMGAGYKGPNYGRIRGYLLSKLIEDYREIWKQTRCTIMVDGWIDRCRHTLINFLVYCPKGTIFLKSVDTSHVSKTIDALFKFLKDVVLFVGPENVVHVVTDNAANYIAAGRLLELEFPRLYWSPCAVHCVNLMFQDIEKLEKVSGTVTSFNDYEVINADIVKLTEPLVRVLCIVDNENRAAMSFLYQAIYKAWEEIVKRFQKRKRVVDPYLKILDTHVIERYAYGDADLNFKLTSEMRIFKNVEQDFGRQSVIRERSTIMPASCKRSWSIFEHIHSKKRSRLEHQKLNDLVYAHYNLRLQQRNRMRKQSYDPICFDAFEGHSKWIMEDLPLFLTPEEVNALQNDLANMSLQLTLDDLDQLNLEDNRDDDETNNNSVENVNQNKINQNVAPDLSDEERYPDFEITP
ncbi:hypothetical protein AHAS_Ahas19G0093000 [Arachis hypogaea]